ncbi:MAG: tRNA 2-thiouridine(34) synthase MnmA [Candidatus Margulisiibacteriota bacterium]
MMPHKKVLIAMSGGVDSSVAAALLKKQGYDVYGATMQIWPEDASPAGGEIAGKSGCQISRSCCAQDAVDDARRVCHQLGIPHYVFNFKDYFEEKVIANFCSEYQNGRTPNPCIRCNKYVKFEKFLRRAKELGMDYIATGHYVRIAKVAAPKNGPRHAGAATQYKLKKAKDHHKDQSYVLYMLNQPQLAQTLFPLGNYTKLQVRALAKKFKLHIHEKAESQDICFVPDGNFAGFLKRRFPQLNKPGPIKNLQGKILGQHRGIAFYTIGQRRGLNVAAGHPMYVTKIDKKTNTIYIGGEKDLLRKDLMAEKFTFVAGKAPTTTLKGQVKIRYNTPAAKATSRYSGRGHVKIIFDRLQKAVTPGQSAVFYRGEEVVGGGVIAQIPR